MASVAKLVDLMMTVPEEYLKDGQIELVMRQVHQRIKAMIKIPINGRGAADQTAARVMQAAGSVLNKTSASDVDMIRSGIRSLQNKVGAASAQIAKISKQISANGAGIEKILASAGQLKNLSYLGIGLQVVNIAVDVAGFAIIAGKINEVDEKIGALAAKVDQIHYMMSSKKIAEFQKLVMRFNAMTTKIADHDELSRDVLETLLIDIRAFISEMVHNFNYGAMDAGLILEIIFDLLTAYSALLCVFLREYHFEKHRQPDNYTMFVGVFQDLVSNEFLSNVRNYLFLERKLTSRETMDAVNTQNILTMNCMTQVNDQVELLELTKTRERYIELMRGISTSVEAQVRKNLDEITRESGVSSEKCETILAQTIKACNAIT